MPYSKKARYVHKRVKSPSKFDKRSLRVIDPGRKDCMKITIGCPKGNWDSKKKRCKVGMQVQKYMYEKQCYPRKRGD